MNTGQRKAVRSTAREGTAVTEMRQKRHCRMRLERSRDEADAMNESDVRMAHQVRLLCASPLRLVVHLSTCVTYTPTAVSIHILFFAGFVCRIESYR
jgi:hypothetical protein